MPTTRPIVSEVAAAQRRAVAAADAYLAILKGPSPTSEQEHAAHVALMLEWHSASLDAAAMFADSQCFSHAAYAAKLAKETV
jgi:hypothetical protein